MNKETKLQIIGTISVLTGFCIVGFTASWWVAGGVFVMLFGNNVEQRSKDI